MVKLSPVTFAQLRRFLLDLGFTETARASGGHRFAHAPTGAVLDFRPYQLRERVHWPDIARIKFDLDWRGLIPADSFDDAMQKTPA